MTRGRKNNLALRIIPTLCLCLFFAAAAHAQIPTQVTPQTVDATLANPGTACTGTPQTYKTGLVPTFANLGQTQHYAYVKTNSSVTNLVMQIQGVDVAGNVYVISDTATTATPIAGANSSLLGSGHFANLQVVVTCFPASTGTYALYYTGTSATSNQVVGSYLIAQQDKVISSAASAGTTYAASFFPTPFGNSQGVLYFEYTGTGPSGSTLNVTCQTQNGTGPTQFIFNLATTTVTEQTFPVPPGPCPIITVQYTAGGVSASTYSLDYVFMPPGASLTNGFTHVTGSTATVVKAGSGILHTLVVGTPTAGTISFFDLAPASCTATPSSNVVSVVTATATFPAAPEIYDVLFTNGICVKASATMDFTVSAQ